MSPSIDERRTLPSRRGAHWPPTAFALAVAVPLLTLAGCGVPTEKADCDQLLYDRQFQNVIKDCHNPYQRASAYLGLGGFDLIRIYSQITAPGSGNSLTPAGVIAALSLTPANIATSRRYMEEAVLTVAQPEDAAQAFALLVASVMGMMVSSIEFLDPAVDGNFTLAASEAALGIANPGGSPTFTAYPATLSTPPLAGLPYFSGVVGGTPYVFACADIALGPPGEPFCSNVPLLTTPQIDSDTDPNGTYGNGAGFDGGVSAPPPPSLAPANPVSLVFQVTDLTLPFAINPLQVPVYNAFSGQGNAAQGFAIGLIGYLNYLQAAQAVLTPAGSNPGAPSTLSDAIDSFRSQLDNGAVCLNTLEPAIPAAFNAIYPIYQAAIGTSARPIGPTGPLLAANPNFFQAYNQIAGLNLAGLGVILPPIALPANDFIFGSTPPGTGTVANIGTRFLYSKQSGLGAFTPLQATPRIDETYPAAPPAVPVSFQDAFEAMLLAPAVSPARDGKISYAELLCIGAGAPPTGVTATVSAGKVNLTWNAAAGATSYTVYRDIHPGVTQTTQDPTFVAFPNATSPFTDPSSVAGTPYYYVVTSTNASGEGGVSRQVSATP